jgi:hypothetical protein
MKAGNVASNSPVLFCSKESEKVIVLMKDTVAQAVLTGSTNFSEGGIYGHSNVIHICEDGDIAKQYLWLWISGG